MHQSELSEWVNPNAQWWNLRETHIYVIVKVTIVQVTLENPLSLCDDLTAVIRFFPELLSFPQFPTWRTWTYKFSNSFLLLLASKLSHNFTIQFRRTMAWFWFKGGSFCTLIKQWKLSWYWWQIKMTYFRGEVSGIFIQKSVSTLLVYSYWREWTPCIVERKNLNIPLSPREKRWIQMDKSDSLIEEKGLFCSLFVDDLSRIRFRY